MPTWGIIAQLSLSAATALVALAVYRVQADKLFLEFRDKRAQALDAFIVAAQSRLREISALGSADLLGAIVPEKLAGSDAEVWRTAAMLRSWFGAEVRLALTECEASLIKALDAKAVWLGSEDKVGTYNRASGVILKAYTAVQRVADAAAPYLNVERRGLTLAARVLAALRKPKR